MEAGDDLVSLKIALAGPDAGKNIHLLMRYAASVLDDHAGALALQTNGVALWKLEFFKPDAGLTVQTHVCAAEPNSEKHLPEMWTKLLENADAVVLINDDGDTRARVEAFFAHADERPVVTGVENEHELAPTLHGLIEGLTPRE